MSLHPSPPMVQDWAGPSQPLGPGRNPPFPTSLGLSFGNSADSGPCSPGGSGRRRLAGGGILGCHRGAVMGHLSAHSNEVFCEKKGFSHGEKASAVLVGTQWDIPRHTALTPLGQDRMGTGRDGDRMGLLQDRVGIGSRGHTGWGQAGGGQHGIRDREDGERVGQGQAG